MMKNNKTELVLTFCIAMLICLHINPVLGADGLPSYLQSNTDAMGTLGRFMNGVLQFLSALLWGIWAIFAVLFAKDLMMGKDAEELKGRVLKLGGAALILLMVTALPALFAGFAN